MPFSLSRFRTTHLTGQEPGTRLQVSYEAATEINQVHLPTVHRARQRGLIPWAVIHTHVFVCVRVGENHTLAACLHAWPPEATVPSSSFCGLHAGFLATIKLLHERDL